MLLYVIRHGHPDYATDTLLPEGHEEARLCAERLKMSGIDRIYSSSMGRALQTAAPTAKALGLPVTVCDWARELDEYSMTTYPDGVKKLISNLPPQYLHRREFSRFSIEDDLEFLPGICDSEFPAQYRTISEGLDGILRENGYSRNADGFYDVTEGNDRHVALFCHCGMQRVIMSHLLHIPYRYVGSTLVNHFTGITIYVFNNRGEETTSPRLVSYGDVGHLYFEGESPVLFYTKKPM